MFDETRPVYTIGTAAEILGVHPRTLRLYEDAGLIRPARKNNRRFYSPKDLEWISYVRYLLHEKGLNQVGLRRLLALIPCWTVNGCPPEAQAQCPAPKDRSYPCWALAGTLGVDGRRCHECGAYLKAITHVLGESEVREATRSIRAGRQPS